MHHRHTTTMVEVFKTNVEEPVVADNLIGLLRQHFPGSRINFDLEDCDRVLRVEGNSILPERIISILKIQGHECCMLE